MHMLCASDTMTGVMLTIAVQVDQLLDEVGSHLRVLSTLR